MNLEITTIRPFIGAKDFEVSRSFYRDLSFEETCITPTLSLFQLHNLSFYLQDYYVKDWLENSMLTLLVNNINQCYEELQQLGLENKYAGVKVHQISLNHWGAECIVMEPSGALLRFTQFY